jgi:hypothetical protein
MDVSSLRKSAGFGRNSTPALPSRETFVRPREPCFARVCPPTAPPAIDSTTREERAMPGTRANVKNEKRTTPSRTRACRSGAHRQFAESLAQGGHEVWLRRQRQAGRHDGTAQGGRSQGRPSFGQVLTSTKSAPEAARASPRGGSAQNGALTAALFHRSLTLRLEAWPNLVLKCRRPASSDRRRYRHQP